MSENKSCNTALKIIENKKGLYHKKLNVFLIKMTYLSLKVYLCMYSYMALLNTKGMILVK